MKTILLLLLLGMLMPMVLAQNFDNPISAEDKATFDSILEPVMKIYNLIKYVATVIAVIIIIVAAIIFIFCVK